MMMQSAETWPGNDDERLVRDVQFTIVGMLGRPEGQGPPPSVVVHCCDGKSTRTHTEREFRVAHTWSNSPLSSTWRELSQELAEIF